MLTFNPPLQNLHAEIFTLNVTAVRGRDFEERLGHENAPLTNGIRALYGRDPAG